MERIRAFLGTEAAAFWLAALVHGGVLMAGYQHREARIAESVIAAVLTLGLAVTFVQARRTRAVGLAVQGFALLGTLVGIFTMIIGVGPQSAFDIALHLGFVTLLISGLVVAARDRSMAAA
jgi:hypothetical protein